MDLLDYLKREGKVFLHLTASEVSTLTCRVQLGASIDDVLRDSFRLPPFAGESTEIPQSVKDKQAEIREVYKAYDTLCQEEWDWTGLTWTRLKQGQDFDKVGGRAAYPTLRPYYYARGVLDPPHAMDEIRTSVKFLGEVGVTGGLHPKMIAVLESAEKDVAGFPVIRNLLARSIIDSIPTVGKSNARVIGGWFPRPIVGKGLSAHALGLAVDINAQENPNLKDALASAVDAVLDYLQQTGAFPNASRVGKGLTNLKILARTEEDHEKGDDAAARAATIQAAIDIWAKLSQISNAFQSFLQANLPPYITGQLNNTDVLALVKRCERAFGGVKRLSVIARDGVYDQRVALIIAMLRGGAKYGGEFSDRKDEHHFECRGWQKLYIPPKCMKLLK